MTFQLTGAGPEIYENVMVPLWFGRWAEALVGVVGLSEGENVLDVACGTGVTTRLAKAAVGPQGRVDGLDINAAMLAKARMIAEGADIGWIESDVSRIDLPSECYDAVISQHGYHYFPDKPAALNEFLRLLAPGGRMAFSIWEGHSAYTTAVCDAVEAHISAETAAKQRAQRQTSSAAQLEAEVSDAGFSDVRVVRQELMIDVPLAEEFVPQHLCSMPIAHAFQALDPDRASALIEDVAIAMAGYVQGDRIRYPDAVHVAIGFKGR